MPHIKILVHLIWSTKKRARLISKELKPLLIKHIKNYCQQNGIFVDCINCIEDHIHMIVSLGSEQTIAKTLMLLKGESSHWVNQQKMLKYKFEWQDEYIALSVSFSAINKVRNYIANQEQHHKKQNFEEEFNEFLRLNHIGI